MRRLLLICLAGLCSLLLGSSASAATLILSEHSSDETLADDLDGELDFNVAGLNDDELTLTVTNLTTGLKEYDISEVYFNGTDNVTGLALLGDTGWTFFDGSEEGNKTMADGFGTFDFAIKADDKDFEIGPDETVPFVFVFLISGSEPFDGANFNTDKSTAPPTGGEFSLGAAKFVRGPGGDSAFGSTNDKGFSGSPGPGVIPLPAAVWMALPLFASMGVVNRLRAKKRQTA